MSCPEKVPSLPIMISLMKVTKMVWQWTRDLDRGVPAHEISADMSIVVWSWLEESCIHEEDSPPSEPPQTPITTGIPDIAPAGIPAADIPAADIPAGIPADIPADIPAAPTSRPLNYRPDEDIVQAVVGNMVEAVAIVEKQSEALEPPRKKSKKL